MQRFLHSIVKTACVTFIFVLVTVNCAAAQYQSTTSEELASKGITFDKEAAANFKITLKKQAYLTDTATRRLDELNALYLTYKVEGDKNTYTVYRSPDYILALNDKSVIAMSKRGAFRLSRPAIDKPYRLEIAITVSELAANPGVWQEFIRSSGLRAKGIFPHGDSDSPFLQIDSILGRAVSTIQKIEPDTNGRLWLDYIYTPVLKGKGILSETGRLLIDPKNYNVVLENLRTLSEKDLPKAVTTIHEKLSYQAPSSEIPFALVNEWNFTETADGNKPILHHLKFTDYKIEKLDRERLRLSFYNLPNELVEDATSYQFIWLIALVLALISSAVFLILFFRKA
ncbi:hypothetical protein KIH39_21695 [Telmatocola sphagniphila]|uniref:DUF2330 domain-containing protein n=1 Tax=Telmatocola sphagniphila TaxID=1123043 RepID=A0A8E6B519_9BACT|nr:hypothetical protein [Telmatocola sphagniphila]QVL31434.1 hypothetical protein KIH39_21695 [Telmatocola sphagniphila]